jgi:hypothetical protein
MKTAFTLWKGSRSRGQIEQMKNAAQDSSSPLMLPLHAAVLLSYPIEEVMRFFPLRLGRITGYLFVKQQ